MNVTIWVGLAFLLAGFFMIGIGSESKSKEKKSNLVFFGFAALLVSVVLLGAAVLSNTLAGGEG